MDRLIHRFKYGGELALGAGLGELLAQGVRTASRPDLLVPAPASRERLRERGFLPSLLLARSVGRRLDLPVDARLLRKARHTPPQTGLDRPARQRNVAGAFAVAHRVEGLRIAVVDDVMTTGATLSALAEVLKDAGAASVAGWVVARTPEPPRAL